MPYCNVHNYMDQNFWCSISRFTCPEKADLFSSSLQGVLFFFADSRRKKGFQPVKSLYFCVGQQKKKELLEKNQQNEPLFWNM